MEPKKYLKWYNKIGYGAGDIAGSGVYNFLAAFVMIYLTNTIGLNPGIIGTLMMLSKLCDGVSDIFFGAMIDKTRTKLGRARPWMLYGFIGCAITLSLIFAVPTSWGQNAQYAYFFITYTLLNAVFYTANNVAYGTLTALITKNGNERVQMGSIRFMFSYGTGMVVQAVTVGAVTFFGGGAAAADAADCRLDMEHFQKTRTSDVSGNVCRSDGSVLFPANHFDVIRRSSYENCNGL